VLQGLPTFRNSLGTPEETGIKPVENNVPRGTIEGQKLSQNGFALKQGIYEPRADL
jgi:hypothetical protein